MARVEEFEDLRGYLFSLAYRMLGDVGEAEDVVQETFLRWEQVEEDVEAPKAYLAKIATRLCIDSARSARSRRETYVGPWLPEPIPTDAAADPATQAEQADSLSLAFLVVLESLSPVERAVFLLREVFEYDYPEVAEAAGVTEVNARQIAHRAKQHISGRRPRFEASAEKRLEMTLRFLAACTAGEMDGLAALLSDDIALYSDGGGKVRAARRPIIGVGRVTRFLLGILDKTPEDSATSILDVNGAPTIAISERDHLTAILSLDVAEGLIQTIHIIVNPDKLERLDSTH